MRPALQPQYGYWWLAEAPDERTSGVLEADTHGKLTLTLYGRLGTHVSASGWVQGARRILGEVDMGVLVSLDRCFVKQTPGDFGLERQIWVVHDALIGAKFDAEEPWAFCGASFDMPLLTQWTGTRNIEDFLDRNDCDRATHLGIAVARRKWPLWQHDGVEVDLCLSGSVREISETTSVLEGAVRLRANAQKALTREQFREIAIRPLQVLIALATGQFTAAISADVQQGPRVPESPPAELPWYWQPLTISPADLRVQFGFHYGDVLALGADRFQVWIATHTPLDPVFDLYLGLLRQTGLAELSFLMVVQALETYHRRTGTDTILATSTWDPLREEIAAVITAAKTGPAEQGLLNKLTFYNEVSLRYRLKALLRPLAGVGDEITGQSGSNFVNAVVATRNYYTHWDAKSESAALRGEALVYATSRLTALLEILLLRDIGFASDSPAWIEILRRRARWLPTSVEGR
ncbi:MAG: HEPN domain-containing protein [Steroidobacteraceae bacterium]